MSTVNIKGISKAKLLAGLFNSAKPFGLKETAYGGWEMSEEYAKDEIDAMREKNMQLKFDYIHGRPLKVDISDNEMQVYAYDRDNGHEGLAQSVVDKIRADNPSLLEKLSRFIDRTGDKWGTSGYAKSATILQKHAGLPLTRDDYNIFYCEGKQLYRWADKSNEICYDWVTGDVQEAYIIHDMMVMMNAVGALTKDNFEETISHMSKSGKVLMENTLLPKVKEIKERDLDGVWPEEMFKSKEQDLKRISVMDSLKQKVFKPAA